MNKLFTAIFTLLLLTCSSFAQNKTEWNFDGQVQLRSELDGRDFSNKTYPPVFTSLRTRIGLKANISDRIFFYFQAQDSRIFGEEPTVTTSIKNLDLHQGYVKLVEPFELPLSVQVGRFDIAYGTERFLGAGNWSYVARSFDGIRFSFGTLVKVDLFALTTYEGTSMITTATPSVYNYPAKNDTGSSIYGFWLNSNIFSNNSIDLFTYYEVIRKQTNGIDDDNKTATLGINHRGDYGRFSSLTEAAFQTGKRGASYISAYLVSIQEFCKIEDLKLGLGVDLVSGTKPSTIDKINSFYCLSATSHRFYGYMDYFYKNPSGIYNLGINDFYITSNYTPEDCDFTFGLNLHTLSSNVKNSVGASDLGREIDLTVAYNFLKRTTITWGGSLFSQGNLMNSYFNTSTISRDDIGFWSYVMITANF
jgi:Alginate export